MKSHFASNILPTLAALFLLKLTVFAAELPKESHTPFEGCGEYEVMGVLRLDRQMAVKVFEDTRSETTLFLDPGLELELSSFVNRPILIKGWIRTQLSGFRGKLEPKRNKFKVIWVQERPTLGLYESTRQGFRLLKSEPCR